MADKYEVIRTVLALSSELASSLLLHVEDIESFVSGNDLAYAASVAEMASEEKQCQKSLAQLLDSLDATPGPPRIQAAIAAMPYTEVHVLIPRLIEDKKRLVARCEQAGAMVAGHSAATECISAVTHRHREHLETLEKMAKTQAS